MEQVGPVLLSCPREFRVVGPFTSIRRFRNDPTGNISFRNLKRVARELGEKLSDDELQAMIDEFDRDEDGHINLSEFAGIMKQTAI